MANLSPALVDVASRPETVIFVGSGISVWSGLPTWRQLIEQLIARLDYLNQSTDLVKRELYNNDLLQAASYGLDKLTQQQKTEFLREACRSAEPSEIHELIMSWGNSCYMTTNYDTLVEQALRRHRSGEVFDVVTPSQDWEVANLLQARAARFIFKPHGDIGDTAKVVLTREDYSNLKNLRSNVFNAYRMLLASRPVIYIGFGLRDPDFLLLKESIASDFGGSPQDHYAIMPDVTGDEQDYWRRNYGIHLVSYETDTGAKNTGDRHKPLLRLLEEVGTRLTTAKTSSMQGTSHAGAPNDEVPKGDDALALARHARLLRSRYRGDARTPPEETLPITLTCDRNLESPDPLRGLHGRVAPEALSSFSGKCIMDGAPGAGKTFAVEKAVTMRAKALEDVCLDSAATVSDTQIPVYAPLNQYDGDIMEYLEATLPNDLSFRLLYDAGRLAIFLDAYNEIPAHHLESGRAAEDIRSLIDAAGDNTIVITTRFASDLKDLGLPSAHLESIHEEYVIEQLKKRAPDSTYRNASIVQVFQRPMFFQQFMQGAIDPNKITNVHDVYAQLMEHYSERASRQLNTVIKLEEILSFVGHQMIESGDLTLSVTDLHVQLKRSLPLQVSASQLVSWLLKEQILIALPRKRVIFFHHSLPEYFAAHRLSSLYASDASAPEACFGKRRWDQALLLTLGFLQQDDAEKLMERIFEVDTRMGLRSLNYIETDRVTWTNHALQILVKKNESTDRTDPLYLIGEFGGLLVTQDSLPQLWEVAKSGDSIGGLAAGKIWCLGNSEDQAILKKQISTCLDYNYLTQFLGNISDSLSEDEALSFLSEASSITPTEEGIFPEDDELTAVVSAVSMVLREVPIVDVICANECLDRSTTITDRIVVDRCSSDSSTQALKFLVEAVVRKVRGAQFSLYLQLMYHTPAAKSLELLHNELLAAELLSNFEDKWARRCICRIVELVPMWSNHLPSLNDCDDALEVATWQHIRGDRIGFMKTLQDLPSGNSSWSQKALDLLGSCEVDWTGNEDLFVHLVYGVDFELSAAVAETASFHDFSEAPAMQRPSIPNLREFLDRVSDWGWDQWEKRQNAAMITSHMVDDDGRSQLIEILGTGRSEVRRLVAHEVLAKVPGFTLDQVPAETVDWLISDLGKDNRFSFIPNILGTASEKLVSEKLLPLLLEDLAPRVRLELLEILRDSGRRNDRRYVDKKGELLL
ncbi:hypothetical protein J3A64_002481 [Pseudarthrobacter sp. PvP004]|uniref:SIR2 family NAD-dependent protein deacylase n=1 Tax=Pseudarthrobacter sp. PvP004 TaxID=2817850 RepID=UPI001AE9BE5D|nr:SIR2 family protein [Pseudarthrobacter sp. PvP004]MBP2267017.1 hypothetical protein [Pseudarthrobacter sp. PvP004]